MDPKNIYPTPTVSSLVPNDNNEHTDPTANKDLAFIAGGHFKIETLGYLILLFGVSFLFVLALQKDIFVSTGYFSELNNTIYFPIRILLAFLVSIFSYLLYASYNLPPKGAFFGSVAFFYIIEMRAIAFLFDTTAIKWLLLELHWPSEIEFAFVFATLVTLPRFLSITLGLLLQGIKKSSGLRFFKTIRGPILLLTTLVLFALPAYVFIKGPDQYQEARKRELYARVPQSDNFSHWGGQRDLEKLQEYTTFSIVYEKTPADYRDVKETDYMTVFNIGYERSFKTYCNSQEYKKTPAGLEYGVKTLEKYSSNPPQEDTKYTEKTLCFRIGENLYSFERSNAYKKTSYNDYKDDDILDMLLKGQVSYEQVNLIKQK